jgi:hypothetical protein
MTKISALSDIGTSVASNDTFVLVDVSDPTTPNKKIQQQNILAAGGLLPDGSAGTPGLRFLSDTNVGLFRPTTDTLAIATGGSERLRIDSSGRLGLGTSSPSSKLSVNSGAANTFAANFYGPLANADSILLGVSDDGATKAGIGFQRLDGFRRGNFFIFNNNTANASTNGSISDARLTITSAGNVGIGTTGPSSILHAAGTITAGASSVANGALEIKRSSDGLTVFDLGIDTVSSVANINTAYSFLAFKTQGTEKGRFDGQGRLLVGTSTTQAIGTSTSGLSQLQATSASAYFSVVRHSNDAFPSAIALGKSRATSVNGVTVLTSGDQVGSLRFCGADGTDIETQAASIDAYVDGTPGANDMPGRLVFSTTADGAASPTEQMRIKSTGDVLVGTTSTTINTTNYGTRIAGTAAPGYFTTSYNAAGNIIVADIYGNAGRFLIRGDGDAENTNNSYAGISDLKLKENIVDANSQWSDIKNIRVRNYNLKEETGYNTHKQIGVVAQELELVCPGLVKTCPDLDDNFEDLGTTTKSVNYSVLYMKAVKALQEAMERIETLEAKVAALEGA